MMVQKGSVLVVCAWCAWCVGFIFQKSKHLKSALVYQMNGCVFVFSPLNRTHHAHLARLAIGIKKGASLRAPWFHLTISRSGLPLVAHLLALLVQV